MNNVATITTQQNNNALADFVARHGLTKKVKPTYTKAIALNSFDNALAHLDRKIAEARSKYLDGKEISTNLISNRKGDWVVALYLGKTPLYLGGDQFITTFENFDDAIATIEDFVVQARNGEQAFVDSVNNALRTIRAYKKTDRSVKGHS